MSSVADAKRFVLYCDTKDGRRYVCARDPVAWTPHLYIALHLDLRTANAVAAKLPLGVRAHALDSSRIPMADETPPRQSA